MAVQFVIPTLHGAAFHNSTRTAQEAIGGVFLGETAVGGNVVVNVTTTAVHLTSSTIVISAVIVSISYGTTAAQVPAAPATGNGGSSVASTWINPSNALAASGGSAEYDSIAPFENGSESGQFSISGFAPTFQSNATIQSVGFIVTHQFSGAPAGFASNGGVYLTVGSTVSGAYSAQTQYTSPIFNTITAVTVTDPWLPFTWTPSTIFSNVRVMPEARNLTSATTYFIDSVALRIVYAIGNTKVNVTTASLGLTSATVAVLNHITVPVGSTALSLAVSILNIPAIANVTSTALTLSGLAVNASHVEHVSAAALALTTAALKLPKTSHITSAALGLTSGFVKLNRVIAVSPVAAVLASGTVAVNAKRLIAVATSARILTSGLVTATTNIRGSVAVFPAALHVTAGALNNKTWVTPATLACHLTANAITVNARVIKAVATAHVTLAAGTVTAAVNVRGLVTVNTTALRFTTPPFNVPFFVSLGSSSGTISGNIIGPGLSGAYVSNFTPVFVFPGVATPTSATIYVYLNATTTGGSATIIAQAPNTGASAANATTNPMPTNTTVNNTYWALNVTLGTSPTSVTINFGVTMNPFATTHLNCSAHAVAVYQGAVLVTKALSFSPNTVLVNQAVQITPAALHTTTAAIRLITTFKPFTAALTFTGAFAKASRKLNETTAALTLTPSGAIRVIETVSAPRTQVVLFGNFAGANVRLIETTKALTLGSGQIRNVVTISQPTRALTLTGAARPMTTVAPSTRALTLTPSATIKKIISVTQPTRALSLTANSGPLNNRVRVATGTVTLASVAIVIDAALRIAVPITGLNLHSSAIAINAGIRLLQTPRALTLASGAITINAKRTIAVSTAVLALVGNAARAGLNKTTVVTTRALSLIARPVTVIMQTTRLQVSGNTVSLATTVHVSIAALALIATTIDEAIIIRPSSSALSLFGNIVIIDGRATFQIPSQSLTLTPATVAVARVIATGGSLVLTPRPVIPRLFSHTDLGGLTLTTNGVTPMRMVRAPRLSLRLVTATVRVGQIIAVAPASIILTGSRTAIVAQVQRTILNLVTKTARPSRVVPVARTSLLMSPRPLLFAGVLIPVVTAHLALTRRTVSVIHGSSVDCGALTLTGLATPRITLRASGALVVASNPVFRRNGIPVTLSVTRASLSLIAAAVTLETRRRVASNVLLLRPRATKANVASQAATTPLTLVGNIAKANILVPVASTHLAVASRPVRLIRTRVLVASGLVLTAQPITLPVTTRVARTRLVLVGNRAESNVIDVLVISRNLVAENDSVFNLLNNGEIGHLPDPDAVTGIDYDIGEAAS